MVPSVLIIGGGIAGLSAGCFSRMNGFQTEILEMHSQPGGVCTAWSRKGYTFDLSIHWLVGSKPGSALFSLYEKIGLTKGMKFIQHEYWVKVFDQQGHELTIYNNPDKLKTELLRISHEDSAFITKLCKDIRKLSKMKVPVELTILDKLQFLPILSLIKKYKPDVASVMSEIKDPVLQKMLTVGLDFEGQSAFFSLMGLAMQGAGNAGYPIGGSLPMAKAIETKFLELGGTIRYKSRVDSIITQDNRATGVRLSDGSELFADCVISCADGYSTIFNWLKGDYCDDTIRGYYQNLKRFPPILFISLGINRDLKSLPHETAIILNNPVEIGGTVQDKILFHNHAYDPTLFPMGKGVISTTIPVSYDWWEQLPYQEDVYKKEKEKAANQVIDLLLTQFPELSETIEVTDVASPMTFVRYTGNWRGSYEGWLVTPESFFLELPMTLPGLNRFYMAGQWVIGGGGIPGTIKSGRMSVKNMCQELNQPFRE